MSTWMVVEDEPDLYDTLLALFEIWSIDGVAFTNGTDAIKWVDDVDGGSVDTNLPELALLDIRLPGASGPEIGQRLRQSPVLKDITIVLITSYHLSLDEEKAVKAAGGADTLIYKPLPSPPDFRAMLQRAIAGRKEAPAAAKAASPAPLPPEKAKLAPPQPAAETGKAAPTPVPAAEKPKPDSAPPPAPAAPAAPTKPSTPQADAAVPAEPSRQAPKPAPADAKAPDDVKPPAKTPDPDPPQT